MQRNFVLSNVVDMVELFLLCCLIAVAAFFFSPYELTVGEEED